MRPTRVRPRNRSAVAGTGGVSPVPVLPVFRPCALATLLRRLPPLPSALAALLGGHDEYIEFRRIVREVFPAAAAQILGATGATALDRETAQVEAFCARVEAELFPVYEAEEYGQLCCGVPFVRFGWTMDHFHDLDRPPGMLLLMALCEQPYDEQYDSRVPLLVACEQHVPRTLLEEVPGRGLPPQVLHERLDGTEYAPAAEFADWLWSGTGTAFLDFSDEDSIYDADWTAAVVAQLAEQWRVAEGILDRTKALADWLEADPPARFVRLLDAALARDAHITYLKERQHYVCEITEHGILPVLPVPPNGASAGGAGPDEPQGAAAESGARSNAAGEPVPGGAAA
jgi:hypothetical protein